MDQVKDIVRILVIQRFWVLSVVVTLVGIIFWWIASSELATQAAEQTTKLKTSFSMAEAVKKIGTHPNAFSHKKMDGSISETQKSVREAWIRQYESQSQSLVWPPRLEEDFARAVQDMRPVESIPFPTPLDKEISQQLRTRYSNYMHEVLPKLAEIIKAEWKPTGSAPKGEGFGAPPPLGGIADPSALRAVENDKYVVNWDSRNQNQIAARFDWKKQLGSVPQTLQILYAQEDFWVLESIMDIIAETNGDADARYKAAIKGIESIDLGADLARISGHVYRVPLPGAQVALPPPPAPEVRSGATGPDGLSDPAEYRYVDDKLQPVQAVRLRSAATTQTTADAFLSVAKRLPVRLRISMDIRKLNKLITECGNASLPLEVRQVRINRGVAIPSEGPRTRGERGALRGGQVSAFEARATTDPYLATVELFGIVYLYNPPSKILQPAPGAPGAPANPVAGVTNPLGLPAGKPGA